MNRRALLIAGLAGMTLGGLALALSHAGAEEPEVFTGLVSGVAVGGYDPVAYFKEGRPVEGSPGITLTYKGAEWRFTTPENRTAFEENPDAYAPQYGGYCAYAVSQGYTAKGDPQAWTIVDGRLYLNYDQSIKQNWEKDIPGHIEAGDANWPTVLN